MKYLLKSLVVAVSLLATVLPNVRTWAQSAPEPAVVISIAEMDKQMAMVDHMLTASGFPEFKFIVQSTAKQYAKGLNSKKPSGVMLYFDEAKDLPDFLAYIPVSNLDDLLDTIAGFVEVDEDGDKTMILLDNGMEIIVKKVGDVAFIATEEAMFERVPAAPESMLEDLPSKYNFAAKIYGKRIPQAVREKWLDTIRDAYQGQLEMMGEEESLQADLQELNWQQFERGLNDMESVMFGMVTDKKLKNIWFDFEMLAEPNSDMAKRMNESKPSDTSLFKGFLMEGAAMTAHFHSAVAQEDIEQTTKMLDKIPAMIREQLEDEDLSEEEIAVLEKAAGDFAKVVADTFAKGIIDGGATMMIEQEEMNFASGIRLANPKELEDVVKQLVPMLEQKLGDQLQIELNSGSHKDVTFHRISIDVPDDNEEMANFFGEQIHLIVGIGSQAAYLAIGSNPVDLLRKAMDDAGPSESQPLFQMNLYLAEIMKLAARASEDDPTAKRIVKKLQETGGDRIRMVSEHILNGSKGRLEIQDGILGMIKVAVDSMSGGGLDDMDDEDF